MADRQTRTGLSREVLIWLQTLQLSTQVNNVRRDFSNGFLVAEICSHYYPQDFVMHCYSKGISLSAKQKNWSQIEKSLQRRNLVLMKELIEGTIHTKPGAAEQLVHQVYTLLTNRSLREVQGPDSDSCELRFQQPEPGSARFTASSFIRTNLRTTEILAQPDLSSNQRKVEELIHRHLENKAAEKLLHPERFRLKPGPRCDLRVSGRRNQSSDCTASKSTGGGAASCKMVVVRQPVRLSEPP